MTERKRPARNIWLRYILTAGLALLVLFTLQTPLGRASVLSGPDRAMMDFAFKWRRNQVTASAPPVVYLRIDDQSVTDYWRTRGAALFPETAVDPATGRPLTAAPTNTPRGLIAELLDAARTSHDNQRALAVLLDLDVAWPSVRDRGQAPLIAVLQAWAHDPNAPLLVLGRQLVPMSSDGDGPMQLPPSPVIDSIVNGSPNIVYALVSLRMDDNGRAREYNLANCAQTSAGAAAIPSAMAAIESANASADPAEAKTVLHQRFVALSAQCASNPQATDTLFSPINFHLAFGPDFDAASGGQTPMAPVADAWRDTTRCGKGRPSASWWPANDILQGEAQSTGGAMADLVCGAIVIVGGTTTLSPDRYLTPYGMADGGMILGNAIRGRLLTTVDEIGDPQQRIWLQVGAVLLTVLLFQISSNVLPLLARRRPGVKRSFGSVVIGALSQPIVVHWIATLALFVADGFLAVTSAPIEYLSVLAFTAFATTAVETVLALFEKKESEPEPASA